MSNSVSSHGHEHVFVILRFDSFYGEHIDIEDKITIKMVVWEQDIAEREVDRLNRLNSSKEVIYFWKRSRLQTREARD